MRRLGYFLVLLLTFPDEGLSQTITRLQNSYKLDGFVYLLKEPGSQISIDQAEKLYLQNKFRQVKTPESNLSLGLTTNVYWFAIPVENKTRHYVNLESGIAHSSVFKIEFYLVNLPDGKLISYYRTGADFQVNTRAIKTRHYYFPVNLAPRQKAIVFYRIDHRGSGLSLPFRMLDSASHQAAEIFAGRVYAFFFGLVAFVWFFSLITFIWFWDRVYLFYSLYAFFCGLFILSHSNFAALWLSPNLIFWNSIATTMYASCLVIARLSFTNHFLHLKRAQIKLYRLIRFWTILMLVLLILVPVIFSLDDTYLKLPLYIFGATCFLGEWIIQVCVITLMIRRKYQPAYLYGLSILSVFIVSLIYNLRALNFIAISQLTEYYLLIGFTFEFVILSLALVYKFNFHKRQHTDLQLNFQKEILKTQLEIQEQTFQDISQDIHDNIGQVLSLAKLTINTIDTTKPALAGEKLKESSILLSQAIGDLRELSHTLNTGFIHNTGLVNALEQQLQTLQKTKLYTTELILAGEEEAFDPQKELVLFRIAQELLNNVVKHAAATHITVTVDFKPVLLRLEIADNGKGFDPRLLPKNGNCGIGLGNVQSRIDLIKGTCSIESEPGRGTRVTVSLPFES